MTINENAIAIKFVTDDQVIARIFFPDGLREGFTPDFVKSYLDMKDFEIHVENDREKATNEHYTLEYNARHEIPKKKMQKHNGC